LCVGGAGVARGYLGRPDLTAERFVPDPFAAARQEPGARLYRTGDLARRLASGEVLYLGRGDGQLKLRGFRIEPGEIEAALVRHPGVLQAAVVADREASGGRLVAFVVPRQAAESPTPSALRDFLTRQLPPHLVPALFTTLDALPRTTSGKVDRLALAKASSPGTAAAPPPEAERGPIEEVLAAIWS